MERYTEQMLRCLGCEVARMPEAPNRKRCDFRCVDKSGKVFLVELKTIQACSQHVQPDADGVFGSVEEWHHRSGVDSGVRHAARQLRETSEDTSVPLQLLWIACDLHDSEFCIQQAMGDLFGIRGLVCDIPGEGEDQHIRCLYARAARLDRCPGIAAVVFQQRSGLNVMLNPASPLSTEVVGLDAMQLFKSHGAILDPNRLRLEDGFVACEQGRKYNNGQEQFAYLRSQYGIQPRLFMDFKRFRFGMKLPD